MRNNMCVSKENDEECYLFGYTVRPNSINKNNSSAKII